MGEPQTYAELQACLLAWLDDSSANVNPAECIGLAERRLSRLLNVPEMEAKTTIDAGAATIDLPSDFREVRACMLNMSPLVPIAPVSIAALRSLFPSSRTGQPQAYAISGSSLLIGPSPNAAYTIILTYKQAIPSLSDDNPVNWLLAKHPDLYVAASLAMAEFRGWNDARLPMLKAWYDELVGEVNEAGKRARYASGTLRMRATVTESFGLGTGTGGGAGDSEYLVDG
ncbi:MAG TPA: hypothetical protein VNT42_05225 [Sphingomonas sp.]|nr:hypothetical protein [Sphingomonas sp.]